MKPKKSAIAFSDVVGVIKSKDISALRALLKNRHIEFIDSKRETVLHTAARLGDVDVIRTLLEDWRVARLLDDEMFNSDTPLVAAARCNNVGTVQVLADHGANVWRQVLESGNTILHFAASLQDSELLNALTARNPPPKVINKRNQFGETALDIALMEYFPNVQVLLQAGADYSKPNELTGRNVLHTSVAYNQCGVLQELLTSQKSRKLTNLVDRRGDSPLMLAIRMACLTCVQSLIKFVTVGKEFNEVTGESLLHMAVETDRNDILSDILMFSHEHVINYKDFEGRTPLLLAIECEKNQCLKKLMNTQNIYEKNGITQETALHAAIRVNNVEALSLLMENNLAGTWCFTQQNIDGKTPLWVAVESDNAQFVAEARKERWVDVEQLNQHGDSCMYVAAACGHIKVLKTLLLSDKFYSFCRTYDQNFEFKGRVLVKEAEISCDIYSSDIFILTDEVRQNISHSWFPKSFLNSNEKNGRNIFHACALGGNVHCLHFIYSFLNMFSPSDLPLFDNTDVFGDTPLQLATRNELGGLDCVYYFLSHQANISSYNKKGEYVLESILRNTDHSTDLLNCVLNDGIIYDQEAKGLQEESRSLRINFSILKPSEPTIRVVRLFYDKIHGGQRYKLLEHSLFKMFVHLVLTSVNYFFIIRFILSCCSALLLTVYIIFFCNESSEALAVRYMRFALSFCNVLGLLFSVPLLAPIFIHKEFSLIEIFTMTLMVLPCLLAIGLTIVPHGSYLFFEMASITVLIAFLSLKMYSTTIFKNISHQMAMLSQVIYGMIKYGGTVILVLWAFSLAFYCIFHNSFYFVGPFKSFVYTTSVLLLDDTSGSFNFFYEKHFLQNKTHPDGTTKTISDIFASQLDLYFECSIILTFIIMGNLALMNMLISLAVRDGKTLETSGSIFRRHLQILWLSNLEMFLESFSYKLIKNTPLIYMFGIIPSRTFINVSMIYYPMAEKNNTAFTQKSIRELKKTIGRSGRGTRDAGTPMDLQRTAEILPRKTKM